MMRFPGTLSAGVGCMMCLARVPRQSSVCGLPDATWQVSDALSLSAPAVKLHAGYFAWLE